MCLDVELMTKRNLAFLILLFMTLLTSVRFIWNEYHMNPQPYAVKGVLDLTNFDFNEGRTVLLDGEWEFYPERLSSGTGSENESDKSYVQISDSRGPMVAQGRQSSSGYGIYRLEIVIGEVPDRIFGLKIYDMDGPSQIFANGRLLAGGDNTSGLRDQYVMSNVPYCVFFASEQNRIAIELRVADNDDANGGGIFRPIAFGNASAIHAEQLYANGLSVGIGIILLLHGIYAAILYAMRPKHKEWITFIVLIVCIIITLFINYDKLILSNFPVDFEWITKITYLAYIGVAACTARFIRYLLTGYRGSRVFRWFIAICAAYALLVLVLPAPLVTVTKPFLYTINILPPLAAPYFFFRRSIRVGDADMYLALSATAAASQVIWGVIHHFSPNVIPYYPLDIVAAFLGVALYLSKKYFQAAEQTEQFAVKLRKADKQKDELLSNISHELKNPLHGIVNIAISIMETDRNILPDKTIQNLELLVAMGRRMSAMLEDLLDVTRLKESMIRLHPTSVRVQSVVAGVIEMLRFMTDGKPVRLHVNMDDGFPPVKADENRLVQILFNLLHNAIKFTDEGEITIRADLNHNMATIYVSDTGIGIDEKVKERIFLPREQEHSGLIGTSTGLGLGLSICKQLVELHGGRLDVSSSPGEGSVFSFTLPLSDETVMSVDPEIASFVQPSQAAAAEAGIPETNPGSDAAATTSIAKILVVDDDSVNLKIMANMLDAAQYDISTATSAAEAMEMLDNGHYDLVISAVLMSRISGYTLTRMIRERYSVSELPILLLTARSRSEDIITVFESGANDYVTKPVHAWELKSRVRALTQLKQSVEERLRIEAAWLQAQIQPHFLYNTLNSIAALGTMDLSKMQILLVEFGNYLRTSFDIRNSDRVVSLKRELSLVRSYLFIQQERFGERLKVKWEVDANLNLSLPPLSIQTLVENALRHGVLQRARGGEIGIRIQEYPDYTEICVYDNGIGMSEEKVKQILEKSPDIGKGIGLRNTDRRLKQIYGKGLHIESALGQGTSATFCIPK